MMRCLILRIFEKRCQLATQRPKAMSQTQNVIDKN